MMDESIRRKVNLDFDLKPSFHHIFNVNFSLPYIKDKKVLDIGCWTGQFEKVASKYTKEIWGIDPGIEAIKIAKGLVPDAEFKVGNALHLKFKNNSFETVTILDVIEHIPKNTEEKCLKEIKRVLKPNGHLIISTPNAHLLSILLDPAFFLLDHRHYSEKKLKNLLINSGFKVIKIKKTGGIMRMTTSIIQTVYKHLFKKKFIMPNWLQKKINNEYTRHGFAEIHIIAKVDDF
jgi:ubiquinone/menaquinone biosynthesis C-methylase UbiE